jgi:hypothetical protein
MTTRYTKEDFARKSEQIREAITISVLWEKFYPGTVPSPRQRNACHCPWRKDEHPSFWVSRDDRAWLDRTTGEKGNAFNFYIEAMGCDAAKAFKDLLQMFEGNLGMPPLGKAEPVTAEPRRRQWHPKLHKPSSDELIAISVLRSIAVDGLRIAVDRGFLWTIEWREAEAFVVTDRSRKSYIARKIDGNLWEDGNKATFLPGSKSAWPIGILEAHDYPAIALVEGSPDLLAAVGHAWASGVEDHIAPVCMSTAGVTIPDDTLSYFKDKNVRIFSHADDPGREALQRWAGQLYGTAAAVSGYDFAGLIQVNGELVGDLNDLSNIDYDSWGLHQNRIESIMDF